MIPADLPRATTGRDDRSRLQHHMDEFLAGAIESAACIEMMRDFVSRNAALRKEDIGIQG